MLFVQGFNASVEDAMGLVSQLFALGSFPGKIKPVVFAWPCTTVLFYLMVRVAVWPGVCKHRSLCIRRSERLPERLAWRQSCPQSCSCMSCMHGLHAARWWRMPAHLVAASAKVIVFTVD
jgi:hypothetical protein